MYSSGFLHLMGNYSCSNIIGWVLCNSSLIKLVQVQDLPIHHQCLHLYHLVLSYHVQPFRQKKTNCTIMYLVTNTLQVTISTTQCIVTLVESFFKLFWTTQFYYCYIIHCSAVLQHNQLHTTAQHTTLLPINTRIVLCQNWHPQNASSYPNCPGYG